jgi:hypothetical protein
MAELAYEKGRRVTRSLEEDLRLSRRYADSAFRLAPVSVQDSGQRSHPCRLHASAAHIEKAGEGTTGLRIGLLAQA